MLCMHVCHLTKNILVGQGVGLLLHMLMHVHRYIFFYCTHVVFRKIQTEQENPRLQAIALLIKYSFPYTYFDTLIHIFIIDMKYMKLHSHP